MIKRKGSIFGIFVDRKDAWIVESVIMFADSDK